MLIVLLITLLAILAYGSAISNFFIADDFVLILRGRESAILSLAESSQPFRYHPTGNLLMATEYRLFGLHPEYYYFQNLVVHVVNAYFVLLLARRILHDRLASLCCALFFVTFSAASEAVF